MTPSVKAIDNLTYERYILEQRELEATERRHEIVDGLLTKLPESERTVMTLYYLGEMTTKEIGDFLSVSVNTISESAPPGTKAFTRDRRIFSNAK